MAIAKPRKTEGIPTRNFSFEFSACLVVERYLEGEPRLPRPFRIGQGLAVSDHVTGIPGRF
jgi:hypothetical protein